jgi:hypothetical protein
MAVTGGADVGLHAVGLTRRRIREVLRISQEHAFTCQEVLEQLHYYYGIHITRGPVYMMLQAMAEAGEVTRATIPGAFIKPRVTYQWRADNGQATDQG